MLLINTTFHMAKPMAEEFLQWATNHYAPALRQLPGYAGRQLMLEILGEIADGATAYCIQTFVNQEPFSNTQSDLCLAQMRARHGQNIVWFQTEMAVQQLEP